MNILSIFCFYNAEGIVEPYVFELLRQIETISNRIVFVANGFVNEEGKQRVKKYTNEIIERENIGRDYGAYRHVIVEYFGMQEIKKFEEIVLCNDTFIGFFKDLIAIFNEMEERKCDVWAINRVERGILNHLQSYFLVFKQTTLTSDAFWNYFYCNKTKDNSFGEAAAFMEPKLSKSFKDGGFILDSYTFVGNYSIYASPYECISEYGLPILKRKSFIRAEAEPEDVRKALKYIYDNGLYAKEILEKEEFREIDIEAPCSKYMFMSRVTEQDLLDFCQEPFYIYGAGLIAKEIYYTYFEKNDNFKGYIESKKEYQSQYELEDIEENSKIVIGVRAGTQKEIVKRLKNKYRYLELWDC